MTDPPNDAGIPGIYNPDEPMFQNSPPMKARDLRLKPTVSPPPSFGCNSSHRRVRVAPTSGDVVLIHYLDDGKRPYIADEAGRNALVAYEDGDGTEDEDDENDVERESSKSSSATYTESPENKMPSNRQGGKQDSIDLKSFANAFLSVYEPPVAEIEPTRDELYKLEEVKAMSSSPTTLHHHHNYSCLNHGILDQYWHLQIGLILLMGIRAQICTHPGSQKARR
ncbi:hypothetical protein BX600DRAFT_515345 [Xylariales sp. PMI_506]|nr:hypothetical protein BX600DRAFT_515345 [Xylariales sp. PMI_506]